MLERSDTLFRLRFGSLGSRCLAYPSRLTRGVEDGFEKRGEVSWRWKYRTVGNVMEFLIYI